MILCTAISTGFGLVGVPYPNDFACYVHVGGDDGFDNHSGGSDAVVDVVGNLVLSETQNLAVMTKPADQDCIQ